VLVAGEEVVSREAETAAAFLRKAPRGPYTTARTTATRTRVEAWEAHLKRLALACPGGLSSLNAVREAVAPSAAAALAALEPLAEGEAVLTILLPANPDLSQVYVHAAPLAPGTGVSPTEAWVEGEPRARAGEKDSEWARARVPLEEKRPSCAGGEVLLTDGCGGVLEGLVTNAFFVGGGGTLLTAPAGDGGTLPGITRALVVEAAREAGLHVEEAGPVPLAGAGEWSEAFLTSCVRGVQPLCRVAWPAGGERALPAAPGPITTQIDRAVRAKLESSARPPLPPNPPEGGGDCHLPAHVWRAIHGGKAGAEEKRKAYEASLKSWWNTYSERKADDETEYHSNSLMYDMNDLPRSAPAPFSEGDAAVSDAA